MNKVYLNCYYIKEKCLYKYYFEIGTCNFCLHRLDFKKNSEFLNIANNDSFGSLVSTS